MPVPTIDPISHDPFSHDFKPKKEPLPAKGPEYKVDMISFEREQKKAREKEERRFQELLRDEAREKRDTKLVVLIFLVALPLVALCGCGVWFFMRNQSKPKPA